MSTNSNPSDANLTIQEQPPETNELIHGTNSPTASPNRPPKRSKKTLFIVGLLILFVFVAGFFIYNKFIKLLIFNDVYINEDSDMFSRSTEEDVQISDWEVYDGGIKFKHPRNWSVEQGNAVYFGGETVIVKNPEETVSLTVYPYINDRFPYGFGNPQIEVNTLVVNFNGQEYDIDENTVDQKAVYAELANEGEYSFIFGTGYPAGREDLASLADYNRDRDTIIQILSTIEFVTTPVPTSITVSSECLNAPDAFLGNVETELKCYYVLYIESSPREEIKVTINSLSDQANAEMENLIKQNNGEVTASYGSQLDAIISLDFLDDISSHEGVSVIYRPISPVILN